MMSLKEFSFSQFQTRPNIGDAMVVYRKISVLLQVDAANRAERLFSLDKIVAFICKTEHIREKTDITYFCVDMDSTYSYCLAVKVIHIFLYVTF